MWHWFQIKFQTYKAEGCFVHWSGKQRKYSSIYPDLKKLLLPLVFCQPDLDLTNTDNLLKKFKLPAHNFEVSFVHLSGKQGKCSHSHICHERQITWDGCDAKNIHKKKVHKKKIQNNIAGRKITSSIYSKASVAIFIILEWHFFILKPQQSSYILK